MLPPTRTGVKGCSTVDACYSEHRSDRVYITTNYVEACMYALTRIQANPLISARRYSGRGWVYEVTPVGQLERDSDYDNWEESERDNFLMCPSAAIVAEYRPSWDMVALRCLRQAIEDQNSVSLWEDRWPRTRGDLAA